MIVEIKSEELLTLREAAAILPGRPNLSTLHRWRLRGVRGVCLQTWLVGGRRYTSREAVTQFITATTAAANGEQCQPASPKKREQEILAAEPRVHRERVLGNA